jgi:alkanesulfonate monooxygenase SsuD/methylene tetrahydromethanopterin reductase-like flavin-dependent oxidoreductase (luciferase family)
MSSARSIGLGFQVWSQFTSWHDLMAAGRAIDQRGFEGLYSNDHFLPPVGSAVKTGGSVRGPVFDGWMVLGGWASVTSNVGLGCLVSGAGYRNPGLLVKMATALDHASAGRAILGLGAGWYQAEHRAFGFEYPALGERISRLDEQARAIRGLLDGHSVTTSGTWVTMQDARNDPGPIGPLALLIGGSGEQRTLRIVAATADIWNGEGDPEAIRRKNRILDGYCEEIGRDPATIRRTVGAPPALIRPSAGRARQELAAILQANAMTASEAAEAARDSPFVGTVDDVVRSLETYREAGAAAVIFDWPAPFDASTLDALAGPVMDRLG